MGETTITWVLQKPSFITVSIQISRYLPNKNLILIVIFGCSITGTGVRHTCTIPAPYFLATAPHLNVGCGILSVSCRYLLRVLFGNLLGVLLAPAGSLPEDTFFYVLGGLIHTGMIFEKFWFRDK